MANVFIQDSTMSAIGDAIRGKTGSTDKLLPADMAAAINGITTGGGGDSGDGEMGVTTLARFTGLPSYTSSNPITGRVTLLIPEGAVVEWASLYCHVYSGASNVGTISFSPTQYTTTETSTGYPGYKTVVFLEYSVANPSAKACSSRDYGGSGAIVKIPNAYMKDNILYAGANCKGVLVSGGTLVTSTGQRDSLYFEGLDLRGSQVRYLPSNFGQAHQELKKIWLSEVFDTFSTDTFSYCGEWLEELHFTAATPATVSSSYVFNGLSTSCKIYVPTGSLSAYTSAQYYPSASTYTYIEE